MYQVFEVKTSVLFSNLPSLRHQNLCFGFCLPTVCVLGFVYQMFETAFYVFIKSSSRLFLCTSLGTKILRFFLVYPTRRDERLVGTKRCVFFSCLIKSSGQKCVIFLCCQVSDTKTCVFLIPFETNLRFVTNLCVFLCAKPFRRRQGLVAICLNLPLSLLFIPSPPSPFLLVSVLTLVFMLCRTAFLGQTIFRLGLFVWRKEG